MTVNKAFKKSLIFHGMIVFIFCCFWSFGKVKSYFFPSPALKAQQMKESIRVDLVGLPSQTKFQQKLPDLSKKVEKKPVVVPVKKVAPEIIKKSEMHLEKKKSDQKKKEAQAALKKKNQKKLQEDLDLKRIQEMRKRLRKESSAQSEKIQETAQERRKALLGNIESKGNSLRGDIASEQEAYNARVLGHIQRFWVSPRNLSEEELDLLSAQIVVRLGPSGRVLTKNIVKRSGSNDFDRAALSAIDAANPFPAPPESLRESVLKGGIRCGFPK